MFNGADIAERFARRRRVRQACGALFVLGSLVYLGWRATIFNPQAPWLSALFYLAEVIAFVLGLVTLLSSSRHRRRVSPPAPPGLSVDVFVPVYGEPLEVIRRTLKAAAAIRYPHGTWLLDDGDREERRQLAAELGCFYLARRSNEGAKAGNLNHGLAHSRADFVAVLDSDHIAQPHLLDALLGFLAEDPKVAFAQAPQDFYNTTSFQYINPRRGGLWHDQSYFYNISMPAADAANAASCVGTSVVYRRSALDEIGGIPSDTVTEDIHTSLKLHKRGWRSVYLNETLAYGIGAPDLREYYKSRLRWGHGNVHALRLERVATTRQLSLAQKLFYLSLGLIYLEGWQALIVYLVPVISLLTGLAAFQVSLMNIFIMVAYPVLAYLLLQELACGFGRYWVNELYGMIRFPIYIAASLAVVRNRLAWRSTSKRTRGRVELRLMAPQLAVLAVSLLALGLAAWYTARNPDVGPITAYLLGFLPFVPPELLQPRPGIGAYEVWFGLPYLGFNSDLLLVSGSWALVNVLRVGLFLRKVLRDASRSESDYRFRVPLLLEGQGRGRRFAAAVDAASLGRLEFGEDGGLPLAPGSLRARLHLPAGPVDLDLAVERMRGGRWRGEIAWRREEDRERLADCLFSVDWYRELQHRHAYFRTPLEFLLGRAGGRRRAAAWRPVTYRLQGSAAPARFGLMQPAAGAGGAGGFAAFEPLPPAAVLEIGAAPGLPMPALVSIREAGRTGMPGLDGASLRLYCADIVTLSEFRDLPAAGAIDQLAAKA